MANLLNFKFGQYTNLPVDRSAGTVYVTTDEKAMYIDLPNATNSAQIDRIRIGDIIVKESTRDLEPPYSEGAFYYFAKENALLRWSEGEWKQINSTQAVEEEIEALAAELSNLDKALDDEIARSTAKDEAHDTAITNINTELGKRVTNTEFNTFKESNTQAINAAKKAGDDAQDAADAAQATIDNYMEAHASDYTNAKIDEKVKAASDAASAAQKTIDDYKTAHKDDYSNTVIDGKVKEAKDAADAAQDTIDTYVEEHAGDYSNALIDEKVKDAKDTATAAQKTIDDYKTAHAGDYTNSKIDEMVTEAKEAADAAQDTIDGYMESHKDDYTNAKIDEKVKSASDAAAKAQKDINDYKTAHANDYTNAQIDEKVKEANDAADAAQSTADAAQGRADEAYELAGTKTTLAEVKGLGYATVEQAQGFANAKDAAIQKAQKAADDAQKAADAAQDTIDNYAETHKNDYNNTTIDEKVKDAKDAANAAQKTINDYATAHKNDYTNAQIDAKVKDAKDAADAAQDTADTANRIAEAALPKAGGQMTAGNIGIDMNGGKITNLAAPVNGGDATNKTYVDDAIAAGIKANDAMTFKGTLGVGGTIAALPTTSGGTYSSTADTALNGTKPQKGDTFKVATEGTYAGIEAKVGDLFINKANDDAAAEWVHISSGYEAEYVQELKQSNGVIFLTDGVRNTDTGVGGFKVVSDGKSNIQFETTTSGSTHTITASMVWGTF